VAVGFDADLQGFETAKQIAKARRDSWEDAVKTAIKSGVTPPDMPAGAGMPVEPVRPRLRVADATTEKLAALAAGLPRGLLMHRDELTGWIGSFDRYGGGGSDRSFWLEAYGGRSYTVDRVKSPEPIRIRHLSIGVLGGIQPDRLCDVIQGPEDGLTARMLWTWPETLPEFALRRVLKDEAAARAAFARLADLAMGTDNYGQPEPKRLRLTVDAEDVIEAFARDMARRAHEVAGPFAGALGKARGYALRLATVLEYLWWCSSGVAKEPDSISAQAVTAAAGLLEGYFIPHAERVFGDAAIPLPERGAMMLARHIRRTRALTFNARIARREIGGTLREAAKMEAACNVLIEAGLIRERPARSGPSYGRLAKGYEVNPALMEGQQ
jgi:hypothetical protein